MKRQNMKRVHATQQGAVLISGLIFLVVLTLFVLALVRGGSLEERLARNSRDQQIAREAAEAVLRHAEASIFTTGPFDPFERKAFTKDCPKGLCHNPTASKGWDKIDWSAGGVTQTFANNTSNIKALTLQPRYFVELVEAPAKTAPSQPCTPGIARVTARAEGNGGAVAIVQSLVRFRVFSEKCE